MLNAVTSKLDTLSLTVFVLKSCNIVFRHSNEKVSTSLTMNNQLLRQVMETTYLVPSTEDISCAKDVERANLSFLKQFNFINHKYSFVDKNVLLHHFWVHAMSFYGAETWYIKLNKKRPENISVPYHKSIKRICGRNFTIITMSVLRKWIYLISSIFFLKKLKLFSEHFIFDAHA